MGDQHRPARWGGTDEGKRSVQARTVDRPPRVPPPGKTAPPAEPEASDAAKALAASEGISLADVVATGATGITKADVERTIEAQKAEAEPEPEDEPDDGHESVPDQEPIFTTTTSSPGAIRTTG